jgi:chromosome segregation protein
VHLKTLTLRGFKSFASATTLRFEPGITCVVGPNGSGKSNVVDALAWVMGEQGAKSLRGGKMEDVIFAGTSGRPPLGRAEVVLTIDNTDGALPIDYTEVTISRTMFRNGGSEYAINGDPCRLLDVQELLSDSGIGREMHVIVGQGQLDAVLSASPEDRRGFIEEAAGVLKHRKRKEKALRKLDAMQANLTRVQDLTAELRRQLKPLGRQAEVARRAAVIQADLRDSRLRLLADDLVMFRSTLEAEVADETALRERRAIVEAALAEAQARETELDEETRASAPVLAQAQDTFFRLSALRERFRGTATLAAERVRHLAPEPEEERGGAREPEEMEAEAAEVREQERELAAAVERDRAVLEQAVTARKAAEDELAEEERRLAAAVRAAADRREGLARLTGQVNAVRSRLEAREAEVARLTTALEDARERLATHQRAFTELESQVAGLDEGEVDLDAEHDAAQAAFVAAEQVVESRRTEEQDAEKERAGLVARVEALALGLARKDGTGALLESGEQVPGLLGSVASLVHVENGYETALAAALGSAADAVAVSSLAAAVGALEHLKRTDAGRASVLVAGASGIDSTPAGSAPSGSRWALDVVRVPDEMRAAVAELLRDTVVVDDLATARSVVEARPDVVAVTSAGDVLGRGHASGGSASSPSLLEVQAAYDDAQSALERATHRVERARFARTEAVDARRAAHENAEAALARLNESDARMAAVAEQLGQLGQQVRSAAAEAERLQQSLDAAQQSLEQDTASAAELAERLAAAEAVPADDVEADAATAGAVRDQLSERCVLARQSEMEARLAVRTGEERVRALTGRAEALDRSAAQERAARVRAEERRVRRAREATVAAAVARGAEATLMAVDRSLQLAGNERTSAERARTERDAELMSLRARLRQLGAEVDQLTDTVHRDEVARAEQRLRIEQLEQKSLEELGVDPETLLVEYGPDQLVPPSIPVPGEDVDPEAPEPQPVPYVRAEQEKRLRKAEKDLNVLGKVNPLALEEFAALEERHQFLTEQLEDLKNTRRDLLDIVKEVDERVEQVFTEAYHETAAQFEGVFKRLFPGGEGRLVLTDPDNMLTTGIEVEARPPGKKVKRLSLLSGGERSLTAVALLVAIFKARPSPFYVMDEVEAALDDVNLQRLLGVMEELRDNSQLIVVTHQKRTMEIADALYGVSMRGDGVTTVISQRLRETDGDDPEPGAERGATNHGTEVDIDAAATDIDAASTTDLRDEQSVEAQAPTPA